MRICIFHRLSIVCVQKCGFWGFWGWNVKIVYSNPKKHYPAWIRVCWCIACQNRFNGLSSRSVVRFCVQIKKKNSVVTLAIWGQVTPGAILTKCSVWGDMVDVITCAIFGDCRLRGVGVVRGVSLPSPIDLTCCSYNTGHTTVWLSGYPID